MQSQDKRLMMLLKLWTILFFAVGTTVIAETVNWQGPAGSKIKEIRYFNKPQMPSSLLTAKTEITQEEVFNNIIDSPPVNGFVPWIAFTVTDERDGEFESSAVPQFSVLGNFFTSEPERNYCVGIFDTGASASVLGYQASNITGIYANSNETLTSAVTEIQGVSGSVFTWVSHPLAVFIDGLQAIEPNDLQQDPNDWLLDTTTMVGQSNVSIAVGDEPEIGAPDLPNAIGAPMAVNFTTVISNDQKLWCKYAGQTYTGPRLDFYAASDPEIPNYSITVPLNLIPAGSSDVQYIPDFELIFEGIYQPGTPSIILGASAQSLFFVNSVSLSDAGHSASQQDRFMLDTGAQVTVVGSNVGSLLGFDPDNPEFEVDIVGVTGETTVAPGYYIDSLDIPALGQWLQYTNIPVILLDVASPEGGTLDGIIGMNLFNEYNMVIKGDYNTPKLQVQHIGPAVPGDIAPELRDFRVDLIDFTEFSQAWLTDDQSANWNPYADMAPSEELDGFVNVEDLSVLAENWLSGVAY